MDYAMASVEETSGWLIFTKPWQDRIYPILARRLAYAAVKRKTKLIIASGFRSVDEQIISARNTLVAHKDYYQKTNGAVYNSKGQCMVSAPGSSSHNWGVAVDVDGWMERMTNKELERYGLRKPMSYEPWHVEPIETKNMLLDDKKMLFYKYMGDYPMDIKTFQMITGLTPDGIVGPKTVSKAEELKAVINTILVDKKENVQTGEQAVKWLLDKNMINSPDYWMKKIKETQYLDALLMKIINELGG